MFTFLVDSKYSKYLQLRLGGMSALEGEDQRSGAGVEPAELLLEALTGLLLNWCNCRSQ